MDARSPFHRLLSALAPAEEQRERVRARLEAKISPSVVLRSLQVLSSPPPGAFERIWLRILDRIEPRVAVSLFEFLRDFLMPAKESARFFLLGRLAPVPVVSGGFQRPVKWAAALLVLLVMLRMTPLLFLAAPRSSADSSVIVVPTEGHLSVSLRGLWEPVTRELSLKQGAQFRTEEGEATFILNDDGNVRMAPHTILTVHDVTNRPEPALAGPTITLLRGQIWVQGFLPEHIRGITVATPQGDVVVHEGSVSITAGDALQVQVWDRHARVAEREGRSLLLVAGERTELGGGGVSLVKRIASREYDAAWPAQNLARDAVHRREIAQLQQERNAARAGILPTSPLYPVKRVAEAVDTLLTFNGQERVAKQLQQATTRLDEATAILASGDTSTTATTALEEYRSTLLGIATGSGHDSVTQFLLRQQLAEDAAQVAAAQPDDSLYLIKRAVLEASAELPSNIVDAQNIEGTLFLDTLDAVERAVQEGDIVRARGALAQARLTLEALKNEVATIAPEVRKEALSVLTAVASALQQTAGEDTIDGGQAFLDDVAQYLPVLPSTRTAITEEEAERLVQGIFHRIFVFTQPRSRWSQLMYELRELQGHPDEGTILRHLYRTLPENGLARYVRTAIVELGEKREREGRL